MADRNLLPKPPWLRRRIPSGSLHEPLLEELSRSCLHTVCREARCPNIWECFSQKTATFLILGNRCTRACSFCAVGHGPGDSPDLGEPGRIAEAVRRMGLDYIVITSVTRDDLADGGAGHFARTIRALKAGIPGIRVEVLVPDFGGSLSALETVLNTAPDVLSHNLETVPRLYPAVRPQADYERSLSLLRSVSAPPAKSGLMLGLGEEEEEIRAVLEDLRDAGCRLLTLGQYLQPGAAQVPVARYVSPEEFDAWKETALAMGFMHVASGPFVRSSYHAREMLNPL